jgi:OOP family OmpA-OmpF porin
MTAIFGGTLSLSRPDGLITSPMAIPSANDHGRRIPAGLGRRPIPYPMRPHPGAVSGAIMRTHLVLLTLVLASGALVAANGPETFNWLQVQGGVTGHSSRSNPKDQGALGLGVGTWINPHFGIEASTLVTHVDYGDGRAREEQTYGSVLFNPFATPSKVRPFLRLGLGMDKVGFPLSGTRSDTARLSGVAGVGAQFLLGHQMFASLEGRMVQVNTVTTRKEGQALAGIGFRWGGHSTMVATYTPPVAETPAPPQAPAPVPAPVLVVVPATQQYCTILDLQFDIDKGAIQHEDLEKLAVMGTYMTKYPATTAVIEGHSDNVGTPEHNLKLSQDRAQSVVTYLTDTSHIDPSRLSAVGYGESRPIADNSTEEGKRQNRRTDAVIACVTDVAGLTVVPARMTVALFIDFDRNKADVKPEYDGQLSNVADFLKANPTVSAWVEGHTGNLEATPALAMEISKRRATKVVDYLVDHFGIDRSRLTASGWGNNWRYAYNTSAEGGQENRRVNIIINYPR